MSAACLSYCHTSRGCSPLVLSCGLALGPPLLACLVCPSCLIGSSAPHGFRCLPHPLVFLIGSSSRLPASYRSAPRPIDKRSGAKPQSTAGGGGEWLTAAAWLLAYPGWRREVIGCGWRRAAGVMALLSVRGRPACLPSWRWTGRLGHLFSPISSAHPIGYDPPGHPIDGGDGFFSFSPDPLPPALLGLLAWGLFPRPRPGDVSVAAWLAAAGGRACSLACYRARAALSLRSFARCYMLRVACVVVSTCGVVGRFTGYFVRLLVGVSVFKYMPLNRILWLLTGIFGDVVCCPFSALSAASFPPLCPAFRPFPVAVSWRRRGRFPAVS